MFKKLFYNVLDDNDIKYLKLSKEKNGIIDIFLKCKCQGQNLKKCQS